MLAFFMFQRTIGAGSKLHQQSLFNHHSLRIACASQESLLHFHMNFKLGLSIASSVLLLFLFSCHTRHRSEASESTLNQIFIPDGESHTFYRWTPDRIPLVSAHRGGPYPGFPENAIETFENVLSQTHAIIECDIGMTRDSVLVLLHDNTLNRTTTGSGKLSEKYWQQVQDFYLLDNNGDTTNYKIPTLEKTLLTFKNKTLFTLDIKRGVPFDLVVDLVKTTGTVSSAAIITYRAEDAKQVYDLDNRLMISVGLGNELAYEAHARLGIPDQNMIAFVGVGKKDPSHLDWLHQKGIFTILGTMGNLDQQAATKGDQLYRDWVNLGADILATDRPLEAAKSILPKEMAQSSKFKFFQE